MLSNLSYTWLTSIAITHIMICKNLTKKHKLDQEIWSLRYNTIIWSTTTQAKFAPLLNLQVNTSLANGEIAFMASHKQFPIGIDSNLLTTRIANRNSRLHHFDISLHFSSSTFFLRDPMGCFRFYMTDPQQKVGNGGVYEAMAHAFL